MTGFLVQMILPVYDNDGAPVARGIRAGPPLRRAVQRPVYMGTVQASVRAFIRGPNASTRHATRIQHAAM
jgi:hypothetical protein